MVNHEKVQEQIFNYREELKKYLSGEAKEMSSKISFSCPVWHEEIEAYTQTITAQIYLNPYYEYMTIGILIFKDEKHPKNGILVY